MIELCSYTDVQDYPGIVDLNPEDQAWMVNLISLFSASAERITGREFLKKVRTKQVSIDYDTNALQLTAYGDTTSSITTIHQDSTRAFASSTLVDSASYWFETETGIVWRDYGCWMKGNGAIKVVYDSGLAETTEAVPDDLRYAAVMQVASWWQHRDQLGLEQRQFGQSDVSIQRSDQILPQVREILGYYAIP